MKNSKKQVAINQLRFLKNLFQTWLLPLILLVLVSYFVYLALSFFSAGFSFRTVFFTDSQNIYNSISNFVELNVAILGIVLTVVAIVVQLAAQKYTPKLADLFLENKVNRLFFFFMVFNLPPFYYIHHLFYQKPICSRLCRIFCRFFYLYPDRIVITLLQLCF